MNAEQPKGRLSGSPRPFRSPLAALGGFVLLVGVVASTLAITTTKGSGLPLAGRRVVGYTLTDFKKYNPQKYNPHRRHSQTLYYFISGNVTSTLYPGTSSTIDLSFTNPNYESITVPPGAISITITSPRRKCPAYPNFEVVHTLTAPVTIPGDRTTTLSALGVHQKDWPVIKMVTTRFTQDACAGMTFVLHYSAGFLLYSPGHGR